MPPVAGRTEFRQSAIATQKVSTQERIFIGLPEKLELDEFFLTFFFQRFLY